MAKLPSEDIQSKTFVPFIDMEFTPTQEKETPKYNKRVSESIYTSYTSNKTEQSYDTAWIDAIRLIGKGKQDVDFYKRYMSNSYNSEKNSGIDIDSEELLFYQENQADASRYGWISAIWDNVSPIANVKTIAKSYAKQMDYDIRANLIDIDAMEEEDLRMMQQYAKAKAKPIVDFYSKKWGLPTVQNNFSSDYDKLVEIKNRGGFKPRFVLGLQQIMRHTEKISDWDDDLKERFFDDIFDLGTAFAISKYCSTTYKVKWEYLDPKDVIVQYSDRHDFKDSDYFAHFEYPTLNKLRAFSHKITDGDKYGLTETEWRKIGKLYSTYQHNIAEKEWLDDSKVIDWNGRHGDTKVCVLHSYWMDYEVEKEVEYVNKKYNRKKRRPYKDGEKIREGDKLVQNRTQKVYHCSWIVGTDYVFDYGPMPNQPRLNIREAKLPFAGFKMKEKPYTQRLAPAAHMFAIGWIRFCNAIAKAQNDGYVIDITALADIDRGDGSTMQWNEVLDMLRQENILLVDSTKHMPQFGGTGMPIQKIQGTLADDMLKEMHVMESAYQMIEKLTGLSPVSLGATPTRDQAVGTTEMSLNSANNALRLIIGGVMTVKKGLGQLTSSMSQNIIKEDEEAAKAYARVIGMDDVDSIKQARREFMEFGIDLEPRPSEQLKANLVDIAKMSLEKRNQGMAGIDEAQFAKVLYHFDTGGDFLEMLYKLEMWMDNDKKRIEQEKQALQKAQEEANTRTAIASEEARRQTMMEEAQVNKDRERAKAMADVVVENEKAINELTKLVAEWRKENGDPTQYVESEIAKLRQQNAA